MKRVRQERAWHVPGNEAQPEWEVPHEPGGMVGDGAEGAAAGSPDSPKSGLRLLSKEPWESPKHLEQQSDIIKYLFLKLGYS